MEPLGSSHAPSPLFPRLYVIATSRVMQSRSSLLSRATNACDVYHCVRSLCPHIFRPMATAFLTEVPSAVLEALADVVGEEPSPMRPLTVARSPLPGLGPLARLRLEVRLHLLHAREGGTDECTARCALLRAVEAVTPSWTPEWSTHLLREEFHRWCSEAYAD
jgi:hypothetical protein